MTKPLAERLIEIAESADSCPEYTDETIRDSTVALLTEAAAALTERGGTIARLEAALVAIIETGPECEHCEERRDGGPREHRPITHETTLWNLPVYLCAEHAPERAASYRKAESKGSGKQPDVVPYTESEPIRIARSALTAARGEG